MRKKLLLIPTPFELGKVEKYLGQSGLDELSDRGFEVELCGFGLVVSGIKTSELIARYRSEQVVLLGIAGSLSDQIKVGRAYRFNHVMCYGIGVGSGDAFQTSDELNWRQWDLDPKIGDSFELVVDEPGSDPRSLLSVCSASADADDVSLRLGKFPDVVAEDMEGFAVAAACQFASVDLQIIRGISNVAGDRDKSTWRIDEAIADAIKVLREARMYKV